MKITFNTPFNLKKPMSYALTTSVLKWLALCATATLVACVGIGATSPEDVVKQRANERWKALVAGDFSRSYSYTSPSFRGLISQDVYRGRIGSAVTWIAGEAVSVQCPEPVKCVAKVRIDYRPVLRGRAGESFSTYADETWVLEGAQWWVFEPLKAN